MNTQVNELLDIKGHEVFSIDPDKSALDAVRDMNRLGVGSLLVLESQGKPLGIISEQDCRKVLLNEQNPRHVRVSELMTRDLVVVSPQATVEECMKLMTEKRVRHLPVLDRGDVVTGVLSIGDVVKYLYNDRERMVENLEKYITGSM